MEAAEMKMLRFSLGVTRLDRIRNELIRGTAHVACVSNKVREARLRWFGHVQRRDSEFIGRRMLEMELPGKRARGRPRRRYMDVLTEDMRLAGVRVEDAQDRTSSVPGQEAGGSRTCSSQTMKMSAAEISQVLKEGELEKRSDNLLQLWRRKTCVLTTDSLNIYADTQKRSRGKELKLQSIRKVDCVERTGKFVYFTIVTTDNKEIDFRCSGEDNCWNAVITMALINYQNRKAIQDFKTRQDNESASPGQQERRMARAP
ncbi:hypothetical protein Q5P01_012240 [Channa striata]|uniref:Pleckstrin homology-like domain family A member 2 n=1 Tax=Channa striata TaxID=64152 RepID=A0AA88MPG0_CHASR|nr:hypothetical protein Q5P01_012240 [Channa striata]